MQVVKFQCKVCIYNRQIRAAFHIFYRKYTLIKNYFLIFFKKTLDAYVIICYNRVVIKQNGVKNDDKRIKFTASIRINGGW